MEINIKLNYAEIDKNYRIFAYSENEIDFRRQKKEAERCTVCYAACELKNYLTRLLKDCTVSVTGSMLSGAFNIELISESADSDDESYVLEPEKTGIRIIGSSRVGVLYGAYEFLKMQGIMWFEPGEIGEYVPKGRTLLTVPERSTEYRTPSDVCRGFSLDGYLNENEELEIWMARNRLNSFFYRPYTCKLMKKLGFRLQDGGHIFEKMLDQDNVTDRGGTFWEEHSEWYGTPKTGFKTKEEAQFTQFCVSQDDLIEYLAEKLIEKLKTEWYEADEINVWGFDTWGSVCNCTECQKLGNGTDRNLYMFSKFRTAIDRAREKGELDHNVKMILCAYEGTVTIEPPVNPIPENLIDSGDYVLFAPIVRCYAHRFSDKSCSYNRYYSDFLDGWKKTTPGMPITILEYYNVSKFEDLPLLFTETMRHDFADYGSRGFQYMHIPMVNWGVRSLTQVLYAELCWNPNADTETITQAYFAARYGKHSRKMERVYSLIEDASRYITSFRAWKDQSVLQRLLDYRGDIPDAPLLLDDHLRGKYAEISEGIEKNLSDALRILNEVIREENNDGEFSFDELKKAVNPIQLRNMKKPKTIRLLLDDRRGLIYGLDTAKLSNRLVGYHDAMAERNFAEADRYWTEIEEYEEKLGNYYMPATYTASLVAMISKDALTRSQFDDVIRRIRAYRINGGAIKKN